MRYIADLHIHSKYSRACSPMLELENIAFWCGRKGINIVSTGDFTHPAWFLDIKNKLELGKNGLYRLKGNPSTTANAGQAELPPTLSLRRTGTMAASIPPVNFILGTEIASIYRQGDKARRIHTCIYFPRIEDVEKFNSYLESHGYNLKSDGRPIIGMPVKELAKICFDINQNAMVVPAHAWTPWFAVFGSKSGFNSLEECFEEMAPHIFAIETGLSSDPAMNWRLSQLDKITLISNSDAHSLANLGREANVFEIADNTDLYARIARILREKDKDKFLYTIEFFPEEGMYHFDGHALCGTRMSPEETKKQKGLCPVCKKPLTIGVLNRVSELADRGEKEKPASAISYKSLVPLAEIIAEALDKGKNTKGVIREYDNILSKGGSEFKILLDSSYDELKKITLPEIVEGIKRVRAGKLIIEPGYDGVYGTVRIFSDKERKGFEQKKLL
jgi:uncharacterized protein (TIGR00375 family)